MSLSPIPTTDQVTDQKGNVTASYRGWFASIQTWLGPQSQNGLTATRPTTKLYVGLMFFDSTLGYPVFVKTVGPPAVWVNGAGATV